MDIKRLTNMAALRSLRPDPRRAWERERPAAPAPQTRQATPPSRQIDAASYVAAATDALVAAAQPPVSASLDPAALLT